MKPTEDEHIESLYQRISELGAQIKHLENAPRIISVGRGDTIWSARLDANNVPYLCCKRAPENANLKPGDILYSHGSDDDVLIAIYPDLSAGMANAVAAMRSMGMMANKCADDVMLHCVNCMDLVLQKALKSTEDKS
jgi:hypothetical protein